jgi:uncharacterized protein (TIGR03435 family)
MGQGRFFMGGRGGPGSGDPGLVEYTNMTLQMLITSAYGVKGYQVVGAPPNSMDSPRFDLTAKVPEGASKDDAKIMLQNLLADRFKLTVHRETKELPIYALVVGKNGPKLKVSEVPEKPPETPKGPDAAVALPPPPPPRPPSQGGDGCPEIPASMKGRPMNVMMMSPNGACMVVAGQNMEAFAGQLSNEFDKPVIDMTGLKGRYDFKLRFDPQSAPGAGMGGMKLAIAGPPPGGMPPGGDMSHYAAGDHDPPPSIFAALQEQLGLKLDARKGPVELIVVDHYEKTPTEN